MSPVPVLVIGYYYPILALATNDIHMKKAPAEFCGGYIIIENVFDKRELPIRPLHLHQVVLVVEPLLLGASGDVILRLHLHRN
jgi:hypothetical protein